MKPLTTSTYLAFATAGCLLALGAGPAQAATVRFIESSCETSSFYFGARGDLNRLLVPRTSFTLDTIGYNSVQGQVAVPALDFEGNSDAFTYVVPAGRQVTGLTIQVSNLSYGDFITLNPSLGFNATGLGGVVIPIQNAPNVGFADNPQTGTHYAFPGMLPQGAGTYTFETGALNLASRGHIDYIVNFTVAAAPIPEPATAGLAIAFVGVAAMRRRRSRA